MAYSVLYYVFVLEVLPYDMRAKGMAISLVVNYAALFFNQYVNVRRLNLLTRKLSHQHTSTTAHWSAANIILFVFFMLIPNPSSGFAAMSWVRSTSSPRARDHQES